ncbi:DUF916 and DUF3324 domain-containing protein [Bacillus sp. EAC]|uniref:DUF916 and DUF3324 domain-containing protein n=1 Tax=Bacillus sp. EAC TaxID=1978338 RepID=UPI000B44A298|nr:DUF916 and DUF3324 domain-containing protein [Bacillus sp. EAC]
MNSKRQIVLLILSAIMLTLSIIPLSVKASSNEVDFSVRAKIPTNQINHLKSYFDIKMYPGQVQDLEIEVFNHSKEEETIEANLTFATTNDNGLIDYSETNYKNADKSLKSPLPSLVKKPHKEIVIPAGKSKVVSFTITMPKEKYEGVLLGAFHFKKKLDEREFKSTSESIQIKNHYAYVVGIKLTETLKELYPELHLLRIQPKLVNFHTAIAANIQNSEAVIIEKMSVEAEIYQNGSNKVLYSSYRDGLNMAPNSNFNYAIDLNNDQFKLGKYRLKMKAIVGTQVWEWDEAFTIGKETKELNNKAVEINKNHFWLYISGALLLIGVIYLLFIGKKRNI